MKRMNEIDPDQAPDGSAAPIRGERTRQDLAHTFVELADTMVAEFDLVEFLHVLADRSVELLTANAAGIMLADRRGNLSCLASTSEELRLIELFELQNAEGPCLDAFHSGQQVVNVDVTEATRRWPRFAAEATAAGFQSAHALPLRLHGRVIGAINLFSTQHSTLSDEDIEVGQALADVATIGLLSQTVNSQEAVIAGTIEQAVNGRIAIEQAKGVLAHDLTLEMDQAFDLIRSAARQRGEKVVDVAQGIIDGSLPAEALHGNPPSRGKIEERAWKQNTND
jgi:transcriptional regulator with GAF, ATPase, and Fis domain